MLSPSNSFQTFISAHFLEFGRNANVEASFLFMRREVPVRIANIMKELQLMPKELRNTAGCSLVTRQYAQSFKEMLAFESLSPKDTAVLSDFTAALINIRERHSDTVISMAEAVMELKNIEKAEEKQKGRYSKRREARPKFEKNIQYFLDRLYTSRISTRMLINQHTLLFDDPNQVNLQLKITIPLNRKISICIGSRILSYIFSYCFSEIKLCWNNRSPM